MNNGSPVYELPRNVETRWVNPENYSGARGAAAKANHGRKGSPCRGALKSGETWTLLETAGPGTIRRIWVTMWDRTPEHLRGIVIRMYWDGEAKPAVEASLGDFFGNTLGRTFVFNSVWFNNPEGRNWNCMLPMPFRRSAKITVTNESPATQGCFWYHIDYTLNDAHGDDTGYLHAWYNRENPVVRRRDFQILPRIEGRGRYLGCFLGLITCPYYNTWWGEGEVKVFLDGDTENPTLCGTGTEDYLCTSWGTGSFSLPWYGNYFPPVPDPDRAQASMYRFHGPDPIYFQKDVRVTLQAMGYFAGQPSMDQMAATGKKDIMPAGDGKRLVTLAELKAAPGNWPSLFEREDDWCATVFFYLDRPSTNLPQIAPYPERVADLTGDQWPPSLTLRNTLVKAARRFPPLNELQRVADRDTSVESALKFVLGLSKNLPDVVKAAVEAREMLAHPNADSGLRDAFDQVHAKGLLDARYRKILTALCRKLENNPTLPIVVSEFRAGLFQPAAADIRKVALPPRGLKLKSVPFVVKTELADIRGFHNNSDGLIFIAADVRIKAAGKGRLLYGADGPVKVWVNGKVVGCRRDATNPARIGEYVSLVNWKKGVNKIVFALNTNHGKAWGVQARVARK